jgi:hypothetical protein
MNKDNEYRENAAECERMARLTRDKTDKSTWLDMASTLAQPNQRSAWRERAARGLRAGIERGGPTGPPAQKLRVTATLSHPPQLRPKHRMQRPDVGFRNWP